MVLIGENMKKYSLLVIFSVFVAFMLCGCVDVSGEFKTNSTNLSIADYYSTYYFNNVNQMSEHLHIIDEEECANEGEESTIESQTLLKDRINDRLMDVLKEERCVFSAVDAFDNYRTGKNKDEKIERLYEYSNVLIEENENYEEVNAVVYIVGSDKTKTKNANSNVTAKLFYISTTDSYTIEDIKSTSSNYVASLTLTINFENKYKEKTE